MQLKTRHFAIMGSTIIGSLAIVFDAQPQIILASVSVLGGGFVWDKIEKNLGKGKND